jgi:hypothetical protein
MAYSFFVNFLILLYIMFDETFLQLVTNRAILTGLSRLIHRQDLFILSIYLSKYSLTE